MLIPDRRSFLRTAGAVALVTAASARGLGSAFARRPLMGPSRSRRRPDEPAALEPHIDAMTMGLHHDKHHQAYITNLNKALKRSRRAWQSSRSRTC